MGWLLWLLAMPLAAADFTLPDLDGKSHSLSDYRGKWVLVNYWATWCPPCIEELPELEIFHTNNAERAMVLGINMEAIDQSRLRAFVEEQFLSYPILRGTKAVSTALGKVSGLPTSFLVSPDGKVVARQVGPVTARGIENFIDRSEGRSNGSEERR